VVVGQSDPNPLVGGKGIALLRDAGVEVVLGILQEESRFLNRRFNTFHQATRPYVILKWARSMDGFMDIERNGHPPIGVHWISHPATKKLVHRWRAEEEAILIGATTLSNDDPTLTTRDFAGRQAHRMVLSHRGTLAVKAKLFHDGMPVEVVSHQGGPVSPLLAHNGHLKWTAADPDENLIVAALRSLRTQGKTSVLVEGGAETLRGFISAGMWDEARIITSPTAMGKGMPAPVLDGMPAEQYLYGQDLISTYYNA
jgi:diaminohydroxyphosphoribosylaminopyrimidine deaminase/5-amino-6-(5-phosphoribosylamino)uracil reductase